MTTAPTDRTSRRMQDKSMRRAVLRCHVLKRYRMKVRTRKTARAVSCFTARASQLHMHCMSRWHARADTPIPSRGFGGHINITQRGLCAAHGRVLVALTRRIICAMCECPRLHPCNQYVAAHPCASSVDPRPPTSLPAFALTALRTHCTQLIPLPQWGSLFSRFAPRASRFVVARTHCVLAKNGVRSCPYRLAPCSPRQGQVHGRRRPPLTQLRSMLASTDNSARLER